MPHSLFVRRLIGGCSITTFLVVSAGAAGGQPPPPRAAAAPAPAAVAPAAPAAPVGVDEFVRFAVARNPRLGRATLSVDSARGRYVQAGLYPNPVLAVMDDELGDRTGPGGIVSAQISQDIVRGGKLRLSQAVAAREIDQAALAILTERYAVVGTVRSNFYEVFALQRRAAILAVCGYAGFSATPLFTWRPRCWSFIICTSARAVPVPAMWCPFPLVCGPKARARRCFPIKLR